MAVLPWGVKPGSSSGGSGLIVGSTTITSGTNFRVLMDNSGVLGEYATTGTGVVAMSTSPTLITPALGTPTALTLTNATGLVATTGLTATGTKDSTTFLRGDNTWATPAGSGGSPGGSSGDIQWNNAGSFAGAANITTNGTNLTVLGSLDVEPSAGGSLAVTDQVYVNNMNVSSPSSASGNVLTADGTQTVTHKDLTSTTNTFATAPVLITSGSFPSAASLAITSIPSTYRTISLIFNGLSSTGAGTFTVTTSTNNGSTYRATGYSTQQIADFTQQTTFLSGETAATAAARTWAGFVRLTGYTIEAAMTCNGMWNEDNSASPSSDQSCIPGGSLTLPINAIKVAISTGTLDAGTYALYGLP